MALGKRRDEQVELFVPTARIANGPGHPFYAKLSEVLRLGGFDTFFEELCAPFYKEGGRPGILPGIYFRMLLIGYFEGIDNQRGIAWRCADSLALRTFLGISVTESTPVHASMSVIRKRLSPEAFQQVFVFVLNLLRECGLVRGKTLGIDATTLEANAAMKIRLSSVPRSIRDFPLTIGTPSNGPCRPLLGSLVRLAPVAPGQRVRRPVAPWRIQATWR